jgi:hypothetical protein
MVSVSRRGAGGPPGKFGPRIGAVRAWDAEQFSSRQPPGG